MRSTIQNASPVPVPGTVPKRSVQAAEGGALSAEGGALGESPRGGREYARFSQKEHRPAAGLEEHRASRRGRFTPREIQPEDLFRVQCALIERELRAHPELDFGTGYTDLVEHMKCAAAKAHLRYDGASPFTRALKAVEAARRTKAPRQRHVERHVEPPVSHWRDRCAHTPRCATPTACALKTVRGNR